MTAPADSPTTSRTDARPALPGTARTLLHQLRYDGRSQVRNPSAVFFTLALPVVFLLLFTVTSDDLAASAAYFVPAMMVLAAASGTLTSIAVTLAYLREYGQLKRVLVTPVPRAAFLGSRLVAGAVVSLGAVAVLGAVGALALGATPAGPAGALALAAAVVAVLVVGSALGLAAAALIRSETAAAPLANAISLPLLLASGVFFPLDRAPAWFADIAALLPFTPAVEVATAAYAGDVTGSALLQLALVGGAWTVLAALVAARWFRWAPTRRR